MDILYFFESIRNPVLDKIVLLMTELGSEVGFLAAALIFFWCVDKRQGYYIMSRISRRYHKSNNENSVYDPPSLDKRPDVQAG